ncbi:hypothetical protein DFH11DRAFT_1753459 [Phellopilus nigrolimitatus]|nr:hypothetical protein DFH11DRAFT_1753459 [Phellopilus nigrolimitatus]
MANLPLPRLKALLLSSALADADALRCELPSRRATRAERLWHRSKACLLALSRQMWTEKREREKVVKVVSKVPGSAVKAVPTLRHARTALSVLMWTSLRRCSLCAQFTEVERYEPACSLRSADATPLLRTSGVAHRGIPQLPDRRFSQEPAFQHERRDDALSLPSLPVPHAIGAPSSGKIGPPKAKLSTERVFPQLFAPPAAVCHGVFNVRCGRRALETQPWEQERPEPEDLLNDECEKDFDEKRRRVGGWDMEVDSPSLSPPQHVRAHAASPPYSHIHASHPLSAHPTALPRCRSFTRLLERTTPTQPPVRDRETVGAGSVSFPRRPPETNGIKYDSRFDPKYDNNAHAHSVARMGYDDAGREHIRVDARELVRDAKDRERRGREYASPRVWRRLLPKRCASGPPTSVRSREPTAHALSGQRRGCPWCKWRALDWGEVNRGRGGTGRFARLRRHAEGKAPENEN